ncbi:flagellar hook assembly protein FlgD [Terribacillus saccharophilus]|jgi:flagellar basal-body rod modification protein FlgD|uniref:Flagellar hook assembly protein FlgD n=1 Tax=Terribacillus saccharophilus TaxID=361277 RepID=A0A268HCW2_9BACI|nr:MULTISPECIES: flagellar hook capping FlgD N-terminal domain-containing protein [Terribacillus]PAD37009.1 flagellar hook assembly protein FlgD [Terribacillus saccharophilus]PAD97485.1 flagellar hook assembly protein FlgD [Terribacillus saccharophilus]PAE01534.1 flagellar hook assembly protein FlgD [Terribacillus saccharophilus]PAE07708.1 flagellar hook assembly protein FlgD [Terribacillus saccharophilus]VVM32604.1 Flagellar basal-body rod modification protein FlgD [Terribacillus sp. AE2B 122
MTTTGAIDSSYYLDSQNKRTPSATLDKDDFLQILMVQLQNQDPTSPMDDSKFVDQMTSFTTLEQVMNMSEAVEYMAGNSSIMSPVLEYSHMIDKNVTYNEYDLDTGEITDTITSKVTAVTQQGGYAVLELENGKSIFADAVTKVSNE